MSQPPESASAAPLALVLRDVPPRIAHALEQAGIHPLLARLYAARGVRDPQEIDEQFQHLIPPQQLTHADRAAVLLADAIAKGQRLCVVADYDCDGATACAVALRGLKMLGVRESHLHYVVPDRSVHGYGLTPAIVDLALERHAHAPPQVLITVDNGIASIEGVAHARARGLQVVVTDHHLPADQTPAADVIVNPNQRGCSFPSKHLAGVGVMFYVLLALRSELRARGHFDEQTQPKLIALLDLVALGTVADVVRLDANNRRLVAQGLKRIRSGRMQAGVAALFAVAGRNPQQATAQDFGFALGPRLNAAGRLSDMTLGIECLSTDDPVRAAELAQTLDSINRERRSVEDGMRERAEELMSSVDLGLGTPGAAAALSLFHPQFHEGVVGILAGRLKDRLHRPVFVFARGQDGLLKGSGRSIEGFHLRDALDLISKRHPQALVRFGGHAMAAGCSLAPDAFEAFSEALRQVAREWLDEATLQRQLRIDGALPPGAFSADVARLLDAQVWGQGFEAPVFCERVRVLHQRVVGDKHLKLSVRPANDPRAAPREAIWFQRVEPVDDEAVLAYRMEVNEWQGRVSAQMVVVAQRSDAGPVALGSPA